MSIISTHLLRQWLESASACVQRIHTDRLRGKQADSLARVREALLILQEHQLAELRSTYASLTARSALKKEN